MHVVALWNRACSWLGMHAHVTQQSAHRCERAPCQQCKRHVSNKAGGLIGGVLPAAEALCSELRPDSFCSKLTVVKPGCAGCGGGSAAASLLLLPGCCCRAQGPFARAACAKPAPGPARTHARMLAQLHSHSRRNTRRCSVKAQLSQEAGAMQTAKAGQGKLLLLLRNL